MNTLEKEKCGHCLTENETNTKGNAAPKDWKGSQPQISVTRVKYQRNLSTLLREKYLTRVKYQRSVVSSISILFWAKFLVNEAFMFLYL